MAEEFKWKAPKDIWKGVGIYHLTFRVAGKRSLLGELVAEYPDVSRPFYKNLTKRVPAVNELGELAMVRLSPFGKAVSADLNALKERYKGDITLCRKMVMDNHIHVVLWVHRDIGKSILEVAHGFRIGITHIAKDMGVWPVKVAVGDTPVAQAMGNKNDPRVSGNVNGSMAAQEVVGMNAEACHAEGSVGLVLEQAFIRTLARSGQKRSMIDYVILNPYRRWIMVLYPDLYKLHRVTRIAGLKFRSLGNHWLLDWPLRQMVECSRKTAQADWDVQLKDVMERAEVGAVTYTAAMNEGERYIADHIKAAGYPLVLLMKDGFPPVGSEEEKKHKPGGMMSDICSQGRLLLLEAYPDSYEDCRIVEMTERSLKQKAEQKGWRYEPLPHSTLRWRAIACNEMMRLLSER